MEIPNIAQQIVLLSNPAEFSLVLICGAADTGKSTIAASVCAELRKRDMRCDAITTDSFMIERSERIKLGISGYHDNALKKQDLLSAVNTIRKGDIFQYHPYDSVLGHNSYEFRQIQHLQILIVEGIHAFNDALLDMADYKIFVDADEMTLRQLRFAANIKKRGIPETAAHQRLEMEMAEYYQYINANRMYADMIIRVDAGYKYK